MSKTYLLFPKVLKGEEAQTHKRLIELVYKRNVTYTPSHIVDGIIPIHIYPNGTFEIIPFPRPKVLYKVEFYKNPSQIK